MTAAGWILLLLVLVGCLYWLFYLYASMMIFAAGVMWKVQEPESKVTAGVGAFNLVRRSAFDKTQGFEWLRMEPADDMALLMIGAMIKSGVSAARRGGLVCRGTFYPKDKLLEARRIKGVFDRS